MVSPPFKGGQGAGEYAVAPNGEAARFGSFGVFAGSPTGIEGLNTYFAQRGPSGWLTSSTNAPLTLAPLATHTVPEQYSVNLLRALYPVRFAESETTASTNALQFYLGIEPAGKFLVGSELLKTPEAPVEGVSGELDHVLFSTKAHLLPADTYSASAAHLYEVSGVGTSSSLHLVSVEEAGKPVDPACGSYLGSPVSRLHAVSSNGGQVLFTTNVSPLEEEGLCNSESFLGHPHKPLELFARVNAASTVEISAPLPSECTQDHCATAVPTNATFQGANLTGSKSFFTTAQPLVNQDTDSTNDLYMAEMEGGKVARLVLVSEGDKTDPTPGHGAEVQSVVSISEDGSHVYFVARGVLSTVANIEGEAAAAGAENLYAYDTVTRQLAFVADLCSGPEASGAVIDSACPRTLNTQEGEENGIAPVNDSYFWKDGMSRSPAQSTPDGRFLVFETYARVVRHGPGADADSATDVYRYDAQTGALLRISIGEGGFDANGNGEHDASIEPCRYDRAELTVQDGDSCRAITSNGSTVVFTSAGALSPSAVNGQPDIYVWKGSEGDEEGHVGLISSGTSPAPDAAPVITPSGRDIFFETSAPLVRADVDELPDIYDARVGGGFPTVPVHAAECEGECHAALAATPAVPVAGTLTQPPGENLGSLRTGKNTKKGKGRRRKGCRAVHRHVKNRKKRARAVRRCLRRRRRSKAAHRERRRRRGRWTDSLRLRQGRGM